MTRFTPLWLQAGSYAGSVDRRLIGALWPAAASSGCAVTAQAGTMTANVAAGSVAVPTQNGTGSTLCASDATETVTLTAAPGSGTNRIDLIICRPRGNDLDGGANTDFIFDFVTGTPAASPAVPATPAGTVALAQILVIGGAASIVAGNITDVRPGNLAIAGSTPPASYPRGYLASATGPASQTDYTTFTTVVSVSVPIVAGRRYRISAYVYGVQQTNTATVTARVRDDQTVDNFMFNGSLAANAAIPSTTAVFTYLAAAARTATWSLMLSASAAAFRLTANAAQITVEDIGTG